LAVTDHSASRQVRALGDQTAADAQRDDEPRCNIGDNIAVIRAAEESLAGKADKENQQDQEYDNRIIA